MFRIISSKNLYPKIMNFYFYLTLYVNFFTFISHVVSLQFKQPLFFSGFTGHDNHSHIGHDKFQRSFHYRDRCI